MAVEIKQINDGVYAVNDKVVKQNMDDNWVVSYGDELTPNEARALKSHIKGFMRVDKQEVQGLREASLPLIKYLNENHHPHTKVIVDNTSVELVEGKTGIFDIEEFLKD